MSFIRSKAMIVIFLCNTSLLVLTPLNIEILFNNKETKISYLTSPNSTHSTSLYPSEVLERLSVSIIAKAYQHHNSITINGNENFKQIAKLEGWHGDGNESNPYIIEGINFTRSFNERYESLLSIINTSAHFVVRNCIFKDGSWGISLFGVKNGKITNNDFLLNKESGIMISSGYWGFDSNNLIIFANNMIKNHDGVQIINQQGKIDVTDNFFLNNTGISLSCFLAKNVKINNNIISNNGDIAIRFISSELIEVQGNYVFENHRSGIVFTVLRPIDFQISSKNNVVSGNTIQNNHGSGIEIGGNSFSNTLSLNNISNNLGHGVLITAGNTNKILNNIISHNNQSGLGLQGDSTTKNTICRNTIAENAIGVVISNETSENYLYNNVILKNKEYGIKVVKGESSDIRNTDICLKNVFEENNIIANNQRGNCQALDECGNCLFTLNHWADWISPDNDNNGIVDSPYQLLGNKQNLDTSPTVTPYNSSSPDLLTYISILTPSITKNLERVVTIRWSESIDSQGHTIIYSLYYSRDNGNSWHAIITGLRTNNYRWITFFHPDGHNYTLKIEARCSGGYLLEAISVMSYSINNSRIYLAVLFLLIFIGGTISSLRIKRAKIGEY
ncbi:MAG: right-handed parallel beta-helix repeat-containing protein [Candidatus Hodarchaeota archaeon]